MNKFDDMMALLARKNLHFSQVVAVDTRSSLWTTTRVTMNKVSQGEE